MASTTPSTGDPDPGAHDLFDGAELLSAARDTLSTELGTLVPGDRRYALLMVDNAMGIAARELAAAEGDARAERESIAALYGEAAESAGLGGWRTRLVADIRAGAFDSRERRDALTQHLRETALATVRVSNPRFLQRRGFE